MIVRLGVSPVGSSSYRLNRLRLHLFSYALVLFYRRRGFKCEFLLRCDDTDFKKSNLSYLKAYLDTLKSLDVEIDYQPFSKVKSFELIQSKRRKIYKSYAETLISRGLAFLDTSGALFFNTEIFYKYYKKELVDFKVCSYVLKKGRLFRSILSGAREVNNGMPFLKPFPLTRSDGSFLYNFCSVVDDGVMGVTHVVRENNKLDLLGYHEILRVALGFERVMYIHLPILVDDLEKRLVFYEGLGDATYENLIKAGYSLNAVRSYLLSTTCGDSERYYENISFFSSKLRLKKIRTSNVRFDINILKKHNKDSFEKMSKDEYFTGFFKYLKYNNILYNQLAKELVFLKLIYEFKYNYVKAISLYNVLKCQFYYKPASCDHQLFKRIFGNLTPRLSNNEIYKEINKVIFNSSSLSKKDRLNIYKLIIKILTGSNSVMDVSFLLRHSLERRELKAKISKFINCINE